MNILDEIVRNLKKELVTPQPKLKQYGELPNWIPSSSPILTDKNAVKLCYPPKANNELLAAKKGYSSPSSSAPKTLFGQPPASIMKADHIHFSETTKREEQQIKNNRSTTEIKLRSGNIIEIESNNNFPKNVNGRWKREPTRLFECKASQLRILIPMDKQGNEFAKICTQTENGYCEENAKKAMARFLKRNLFNIDKIYFLQSRPLSENWSRTVKICVKFVTVPTILEANFVRFMGEGMTNEKAEINCDLNILWELYNFDVIKEAAIELYSKGMKELIDPVRKMDEKLKAWMNSEKILQKVDKIEANNGNFYQ